MDFFIVLIMARISFYSDAVVKSKQRFSIKENYEEKKKGKLRKSRINSKRGSTVNKYEKSG